MTKFLGNRQLIVPCNDVTFRIRCCFFCFFFFSLFLLFTYVFAFQLVFFVLLNHVLLPNIMIRPYLFFHEEVKL